MWAVGMEVIFLKLHPDYKKNPNFDLSLCEKIIEYRARHNLTQRDLAQRIGVSVCTITNVETGRRGPNKIVRIKLLDELAKGEKE